MTERKFTRPTSDASGEGAKQLSNLTPQEVEKIPAEELTSVLKGMSPDEIAALPTSVFAVLPTRALAALPSNTFAALPANMDAITAATAMSVIHPDSNAPTTRMTRIMTLGLWPRFFRAAAAAVRVRTSSCFRGPLSGFTARSSPAAAKAEKRRSTAEKTAAPCEGASYFPGPPGPPGPRTAPWCSRATWTASPAARPCPA